MYNQYLSKKWQERLPDMEVLKRVGTVSTEAHITAKQLRWAGHVSRMPYDQLPKAMLFGELTSGNRRTGVPKLRYKDGLKQHLKSAGIDVDPGKMKPKTDLTGVVSSQSPSQQLRRDIIRDTTLCMTKGTAT